MSDGTVVDVCGSPTTPLAATPTSCTDGAVPGRHLHLLGDGGLRLVDVHRDAERPGRGGGRRHHDHARVLHRHRHLRRRGRRLLRGRRQRRRDAVTTGTVEVSAGPVPLCTVTLPDTSCSPDPAALDRRARPTRWSPPTAGVRGVEGSTSSPRTSPCTTRSIVTTTSLAPARAGETGYRQQLTATGGMPDLTWSNSGASFPSGVDARPHHRGDRAAPLTLETPPPNLLLSVIDGNGAVASVS